MAPTKVFVGNLSFKTGEAELAQEFAIAGKVLSANIISRGPRSLGYGFVELESEEEANKAVAELNKKEIDGRQINVEVARPRAERPERPEGEVAPRRGGFRGGRGRGSGRGGRGRGRGRGRGSRGRGGFGGPAAGPTDAPVATEGAPESEGGAARGRRRGRGRGRGGRGRGRGGARRAEEGQREESETTLFVANLPFTVTDDQLKAEFSADGLVPKSAHVVTRITGRSKGYGFVDYESKNEQLRASEAFSQKQLDGRELIIKVALKDNRPVGGADDASPQATS